MDIELQTVSSSSHGSQKIKPPFSKVLAEKKKNDTSQSLLYGFRHSRYHVRLSSLRYNETSKLNQSPGFWIAGDVPNGSWGVYHARNL